MIRSRTLYFVAGETSADNHGAALMRSLRELDPSLRFIGRGGPRMKSIAGAQFHDWTDKAAVVGLWEVIKNYGYFRQKFRETLDEVKAAKPDAVVLIDYPGFNLRLARALHQSAPAPKIIYYISPQVWAWNRGRITQMVRWIDLMLCIFPFEAELYQQSGLRTRFVGHPMLERLHTEKIAAERNRQLIGLFPGSRRREVRKIFPVYLDAIHRLKRVRPELHFEVAAASRELAAEINGMLDQHSNAIDRQCFKVETGSSAAIMQRAFAGIVASGSATLEAAYFRLPFVLVYKVSWLTYLAARLVVTVKHLGMPNVLANKEIVPEFIQHRAKPSSIADAVLRLMTDETTRSKMISEFDKIIASLGQGRASPAAAEAILLEINTVKS